MLSRRIHRYIGLVLLIPMVGWALTGLVFLVKPGYDGAYEVLTIKAYPLDQKLNITPSENWDEVRVIKSVLGNHLLVTVAGKTNNLDFNALKQRPMSSVTEVTDLVEDAIADKKDRYGSVLAVDGTTVHVTTGIQVTVNWDELKLDQIGSDR